MPNRPGQKRRLHVLEMHIVLWDSVMCNLYLNVVMCMAWCEVECGRDVEWCAGMWWGDLTDVNYGAM